jgi:hypothetical protein
VEEEERKKKKEGIEMAAWQGSCIKAKSAVNGVE